MSKQTFPDDGVSEGVLSELGILLIIQLFKKGQDGEVCLFEWPCGHLKID